MTDAFHRRRVGSVRPSHLIFTAGVGSLIDLPNFSVLVRGLDDWRYDTLPEGFEPILEPRLLKEVSRVLGHPVTQLRPAPWMDGLDKDPRGPASRVGVPTIPFPQWLRCTACDELAPLDSGRWEFENENPRRPYEARFSHSSCPRKRRKPLAVMARFVLACTNGHLDDFPYTRFAHGGGNCPDGVLFPRLRMTDFGGNLGANVRIECVSCKATRNIRQAMGVRGEENLPTCRGRHPHLARFATGGCDARPKVIVVGASNQWFAQTLSALVVPSTEVGELDAKVDALWEHLANVTSHQVLDALWNVPHFRSLHRWPKLEVLAAIERRHKAPDDEPEPADGGKPDLRTPEWEIFTAPRSPEPSDDFVLRRDPAGVPVELSGVFADVVQVERLREIRALVGFTRLDAPDPDDPTLVVRAPLSRDRPSWVPASEVRGEGIFLRLEDSLVADWEHRVDESDALREHKKAFGRFRKHRKSDRIEPDFDPMRGWPGERYITLHTLSHLLIRTIALECGYSSASLSELIYAGPKRAGILVYTAVPDAEGTLGGLVSLAEPERIVPLLRRALYDALRCSSDPLCAEQLPHEPADFLHGAACHACLFISETSCERGNRFLDRRFVVPIDDPKLALLPDHL